MCAGSSGSPGRPATRSGGRYNQEGLGALCGRSRRPVRYAIQFPDRLERMIVDLNKPHWGACKIRELLVRKLAGDVQIPVVKVAGPAQVVLRLAGGGAL